MQVAVPSPQPQLPFQKQKFMGLSICFSSKGDSLWLQCCSMAWAGNIDLHQGCSHWHFQNFSYVYYYKRIRWWLNKSTYCWQHNAVVHLAPYYSSNQNQGKNWKETDIKRKWNRKKRNGNEQRSVNQVRLQNYKCIAIPQSCVDLWSILLFSRPSNFSDFIRTHAPILIHGR